MGIATEVAEAAAKGSAKATAEATAKESALAIIKKGGTLKEAYAAAMAQAGTHGQTLDMNVLRAQMVRHKMLKDQAAEAAKKAKAETPPPAEPTIDASKLDYEDLAAELKALKPGESGSYRLPNAGVDVHVTRPTYSPASLAYEELQMGYRSSKLDTVLNNFVANSSTKAPENMKTLISNLEPVLSSEKYNVLTPLFDRIKRSPLSEDLKISGADNLGPDTAGAYNTGYHSIMLNRNYMLAPNTSTGAKLYIIAHEATHGISVKLINNNQEFTSLINSHYQDALKYAKQQGISQKITSDGSYLYERHLYGLTNIKEFVAELYTRKAFQQFLKDANVWNPLMKSLGATFGVSGAVMGSVVEQKLGTSNGSN